MLKRLDASTNKIYTLDEYIDCFIEQLPNENLLKAQWEKMPLVITFDEYEPNIKDIIIPLLECSVKDLAQITNQLDSVICQQYYKFQIFDDGGRESMERTAYNLSPLEILGLLSHTSQDIVRQMSLEVPEFKAIKKVIITKN